MAMQSMNTINLILHEEKMGLDKSIILALGSKIGGEFIRKYLKSTKRKAKKNEFLKYMKIILIDAWPWTLSIEWMLQRQCQRKLSVQ